MFPEPREQAKAIGVYGFVASAGGSIGLLAGGVLTDAINWHWIFFINVPVGDRHRVSSRCGWSRTAPGIGLGEGADLPGAVLLTGGLMLGVYTILAGRPSTAGARPRRSCLGAISLALHGRVRRPPGADREPADAAAPVPLAQRRRAPTSSWRCSSPGMFGDVLPRRAVPAADPRLRRRSRSASRSCPRRSSWARCRCASPSG